jgi:hypothetical protein
VTKRLYNVSEWLPLSHSDILYSIWVTQTHYTASESLRHIIQLWVIYNLLLLWYDLCFKAEKHKILILTSLVWPIWGSNPQAIIFDASWITTLITPARRFTQNEGLTNLKIVHICCMVVTEVHCQININIWINKVNTSFSFVRMKLLSAWKFCYFSSSEPSAIC